MSDDRAVWQTIDKAAADYDQYLTLQRITDVVGVLRDEQVVEPVPPRTDLPLSLASAQG